MSETVNEKLTDEQVENWRKILIGMLGPYALLMNREQIEQMRNKFQAQADAVAEDKAKRMT